MIEGGEASNIFDSFRSTLRPVGGLLIIRLIVSFLLSFDADRFGDLRELLLSPE